MHRYSFTIALLCAAAAVASCLCTDTGTSTITRRWRPGNRIELNLPMPVHYVRCDDMDDKIVQAVRNHLALYPKARLQDLYKAFFQAEFGAEHLISDTTSAGQYLNYELTVPDTVSVLYEPIGADSSFFRVHLKCVQKGYISRDELFHAFLEGAQEATVPHIDEWKEKWGHIESVIGTMGLHLPDYDAEKSEIDSILTRGQYAVHHSKVFTETYHPHYRIIRKDIFYREFLNRGRISS